MRRYLTAARLLGTCALTIVGVFAVDMPDSYLGRADQLTTFGIGYAVGLLLLTLLGVLGLVGRTRPAARAGWPGVLVPIIWSSNIGVFVPAVIFDPLLAVFLVIWHLLILTQHLFPAVIPFGHMREAVRRAPDDEIGPWYLQYGGAARHLLSVSVMLTVAVVGFELSHSVLVLVLCFAFNLGAIAASARFILLVYRQRTRWVGLLGVLLVASLLSGAAFEAFGFSLGLLAVYQCLVLALIIERGQLFAELVRAFFDYPAVLIVASFAALILVGAIFLSFPISSAHPTPVAAIDALFTATSAACVTGLIVLDTARDFTTFGHLVLLALIQIGGLGIMVLSTFGTLLIGGKLGLRGERALGEMLNLSAPRGAYRLTMFIVLSTFAIEAVGAALLTYSFLGQGLGFKDALWHGIFHAVSAFCNAGFALQSDSVVLFQHRPFPLMVLSTLIIFGSFGFPVLAGGWQLISHRMGALRGASSPRRSRITVQSKLAVLTTLALLVGGALLYLGLEWNHSLEGLSISDHIFNAIFQSATLRTAGFNSVDLSKLQGASVLFMLLIMFVGASPGGTGGGIKTTTAAVLLGAMRAIARGKPQVILFDRRIPHDIVYRSIAITLATAAVVGGALFLLLLTEPLPFQALLFEVVSAVATVGLSVGITAELSPAGQFVIIFVMFTGRIGPLTLALLLGGGPDDPLEYPSERIMVG